MAKRTRKIIAGLILIVLSVSAIYVGSWGYKIYKQSLGINESLYELMSEQASVFNAPSISDSSYTLNGFYNPNIDTSNFEKVEIEQFYDNLSFTTKDGRLIKMIGVSLNYDNEDTNISAIKDLISSGVVYLVSDASFTDDANGYLYRYVYLSNPTKNDDIETSLNAYLIRKTYAVYSEEIGTYGEKVLSYVEPYGSYGD